MLEGLLLEVMYKEELKRTITRDFMYISVGLVFFGPPCTYHDALCTDQYNPEGRITNHRSLISWCAVCIY